MMKVLFSLVLIVLMAGMGTYFYWQSGLGAFDDQPRFRTVLVTRGDLLAAVSATGRIEPVEVVDVGAQVLGRVRSFGKDESQAEQHIDYGSRVKKGEILAQIDDALYQGALDQARANLKLAKAQLEVAQARVTQSQNEWERAQKLAATISQSEVDDARARHQIATAEILIAEARIEQAVAALTIAETDLSYTTIKSPINGVVIDRLVDVGQTVVTGLNAPSLFLLAEDLSKMQIWAAVSEADMSQIFVGQNVTFTVDAFRGDVFEGEVTQIRLNARTSHNVVTYGVIVTIDNTDGKLLPYMTANLQFEVARCHDAVLVASQALRWRPALNEITPQARKDYMDSDKLDPDGRVKDGPPTVWTTAADGLVRPVQVMVGISDLVNTEIVSGSLEPGARVVTATIHETGADFGSQFIGKHRIMR